MNLNCLLSYSESSAKSRPENEWKLSVPANITEVEESYCFMNYLSVSVDSLCILLTSALILLMNCARKKRQKIVETGALWRARSFSQVINVHPPKEPEQELLSLKIEMKWNRTYRKIILDFLIAFQIFLSIISSIEVLQTSFHTYSDLLNGRLLSQSFNIAVLMVHLIHILPKLGEAEYMAKNKGKSALFWTLSSVLIAYWALSSTILVIQIVLLSNMQLNFQLHARYLLTVLMSCTCLVTFLCFLVTQFIKSDYDPEKSFPQEEASESGQDSFNVKYLHPYSSVISRTTFAWFFAILKLGYRRPITLEDLGTMPKEFSPEAQFKNFNQYFEKHYNKRTAEGKKICLWKCLWPVFGKGLIIGALYRILADVFGLFGPISIQYILEYVDRVKNITIASINPMERRRIPTSSEFFSNGFLITFLVLCSTFAQSTFSNSFNHFAVLQSIQLKSALQCLIYKKALRMAPSRALDVGSISNHMSSDTLDIIMLCGMGHYVWAVPLKITVLLFLLYLQLGVSALIGSSVVLILMPLQYALGKKLGDVRSRSMSVSDERLRKTNELITGIKLLKLLNWESYFCRKVEEVRNEELQYYRKDALYVALITIMTQATSIMLSLVTLSLYPYIEGQALQPSKVFTGLALFNQLTVPLNIIPVVVPMFISAMNSLGRLSKYLSQPEIQLNSACQSLDQGDDCESEEKEMETCLQSGLIGESGNSSERESISLHRLVSPLPEKSEVSEIEQAFSTTGGDNHEKIATKIFAVTIANGSFTWDAHHANATLKNINIAIPSGSLTVITGSVGSGKSSLVSAMVNEMIRVHGDVEWSEGNCRIGYLPQTPWLYNVSLRDNVVFGAQYEPELYSKIKEVCSLQADIDLLPNKDDTEIGDRGINLSGGQRQRIALARAIYSDTSTVILDDPFSALDPKVAGQILKNAIVDYLLAKKKTVIIVTHDYDVIRQAQQVVVMNSGEIEFFGGFSQLKSSNVSFFQRVINQEAEKTRRFQTDHITTQERRMLWRLVSRRCLVRTVSTIEASYKHRPHGLMRQVSNDPSSPLPCDDYVYMGYGNSQACVKHELPAVENSTRILPRSGALRLISDDSGHSRLSSDISWTSFERQPRERVRSFTSSKKPSLKKLVSLILADSEVKQTHHTVSGQQQLESTAAMPFLHNSMENPERSERCGLNSQEEISETGSIALKVYWLYIRSCSISLSILTLFFLIASQVSKILTDFWLANWTERRALSQSVGKSFSEMASFNTSASQVTTNVSHTNLDSPLPIAHNLEYYITGYFSLSMATILISLITNILCQLTSLKAVRILHSQMINSIVKSSVHFFDINPIGRILSRFSSDISTIDKEVTATLPRLLRFTLLCLSAVLVDIIVTPWFLFAALAIAAIYYVLQAFFRTTSIELQRIQNATNSPIFSHFNQTLTGLSTIRSFKRSDFFTKQLESRIDSNNLAFLMVNSANCWLGISLDYLGGVILSCATITAIVAAIHGKVSTSFVGLCISYTLLVPIYLNWVVRNLACLEMYMSSVERVHQYSTLEPEDKGIVHDAPEEWPSSGKIWLREILISYDCTGDPILQNLNLRVRHGEKVGICGRSGSGKSSVIMAIMKMAPARKGSISIDGVDISQVSASFVRRKIALVPQEPAVFSGTWRENLDPFNEHSDEKIWRVLEELDLRGLASNLYENINTEAIGLSLGQQQLICFSRALLKDSPILILDEATSSLDAQKEGLVMDLVKRMNKTVISIAHRTTTLLDFDRVIVLEKGSIVEDGRPQDLLAKKEGLFRFLLRSESVTDT
ncbi:ATP-binding cassette sub-family C member 9-like isoform X2 [Brevipalpus obovatus]|uniref:ATP-binding cassette sub-family C member 9-like isoform X2 n=1 Tax=Brevipalpus obovatus TaxID=246614 RepID=UPI003D9E3939